MLDIAFGIHLGKTFKDFLLRFRFETHFPKQKQFFFLIHIFSSVSLFWLIFGRVKICKHKARNKIQGTQFFSLGFFLVCLYFPPVFHSSLIQLLVRVRDCWVKWTGPISFSGQSARFNHRKKLPNFGYKINLKHKTY